MDEARKTVLMAEFEDAKRELDDLKVYVQTLGKRLGITVDEAAPAPEQGATPASNGPLTNDVVSLVYENEFHGFKIPKAAEVVLRRWSPPGYQRPVKTALLAEALKKGGVPIPGTRALYRALYPAPRFHNLPGSQWGLSEWYPAATRNKGAKSGSAEETSGEPTEDSDEAESTTPLVGSPTQQNTEEVAS